MLSYQKTIQKPVDAMKKICSISISPNFKKIAIACSDRVIYFYNESFELKDKITARGADKTSKNFVIRNIDFSPDSTILAVAQSDNIIYAYKVGAEFGEQKKIISKITSSTSITCMLWPKSKALEVYFGVAEGFIKAGFLKTHKSQSLYGTESYVVSLCSDKNGKYIISGHIDGSLYIYNTETQSYKKLYTHNCVPFALTFGKSIMVAGNDNIIIFLDKNGNCLQKMNYSGKTGIRDFNLACANPLGDTIIVANYSQFFVFNYNNGRNEWEEKGIMKIENYYSITALTWKSDGSKLFTGNLCGSVDVFDISMKTLKVKGKFEINYLNPTQIKVTYLENNSQTILGSTRGYEIVDTKIILDRYIIAYTSNTLCFGDLKINKSCEIDWFGSGNEKFNFSNEGICLVSNAGEVSIVEIGSNGPLGNFRTEYYSNNLISCKIKLGKDKNLKKVIAYLLDIQTICIMDLKTRSTIATLSHDYKIISLEFNTNGSKLLFKDKKKGLYLYNLNTNEKNTILNISSFFKWVPNSDVIVAQSGQNLCIWYSADVVDKKNIKIIKGTVIDIKRDEKFTNVIIQDGNLEVKEPLDDLLISLGFALEDKDLEKCVQILEEKSENNYDNEGHWQTLANLALEENNYILAERCYSALGEIPKAIYLRSINSIIRKNKENNIDENQYYYEIQAKLAMLDKQFSKAEFILLEKEKTQMAIKMYQDIHKWDESLKIAEKVNHPQYEQFKKSYFEWLIQNKQEEKAGQIKEDEGDHISAIKLYLKSGLPVKAANVIYKYNINEPSNILTEVVNSLINCDLLEKAGEFYEKMNELQKALNYYCKAGSFLKAVELAKRVSPEIVIKLEEKWGDWLMNHNQKENAVNHYIEAGVTVKAIEASISARIWNKSIQLLSSLNQEEAKQYYKLIGEHYEMVKQYDMAEKMYIRSGNTELAFNMLIKNKRWEQAAHVAQEYFKANEISNLYQNIAIKMENEGYYEEAERAYIESEEPEKAIKMYKRLMMWDDMLRLFKEYKKDYIKEAHLLIGKKYEEEEKLYKAEQHYTEVNWTHAVDMYEKRKMFEDCLRICRANATDRDTVERAKKWVPIIGEDKLIIMLRKMNLTEALIDFLSEKGNFNEALKIAQENAKHKINDVHLNYALFLEDEKKYKEAEKHFILANKYDQAINMYKDMGDFQSALKIARQYETDMVVDIYISQGKQAFQEGDFEKMEHCFINARKPELAIKAYLKLNKINEAIALAKKHCPEKMVEINNYNNGNNNNKNQFEDLLRNAKMWEDNKQFNKAIDCYLEVTFEMTDKKDMLQKIWEKAINLSYNFSKDRYIEIVKIVCKRLRDINLFEDAGDYYENINYIEEAIKCFLKCENFNKAKNCLDNISANKREQYEELINETFKKHAKSNKNADVLLNMNEDKEGLNIMVKQGEWAKVLTISSQKGILEDYLLKYLQICINSENYFDALNAISTYGMPNNTNFINIYRVLIEETFSLCDFEEITLLRNGLLHYLDKNNKNDKYYKEFDRYMNACHLVYVKLKYEKANLNNLAYLSSISILKFIDIISIDKPFYDAGINAKNNNDEISAFIFLNKYLDIYELIEDPNNGILEDSPEFDITDIPKLKNLKIPNENIISKEEMNQIKDWLLQIGSKFMGNINLKTMDCRKCKKDIFYGNCSCIYCNEIYDYCKITGLPIINEVDSEKCNKCGILFNKLYLKEYLTKFNSCPWCNELDFI